MSAHKPYSPLRIEAQYLPGAQHAAHVHDAARGIAMILELVEEDQTDDFDADEDHVPRFNPNQRATLIRMAITTAHLLEDAAWRQIDWLNTHGVKQAA